MTNMVNIYGDSGCPLGNQEGNVFPLPFDSYRINKDAVHQRGWEETGGSGEMKERERERQRERERDDLFI